MRIYLPYFEASSERSSPYEKLLFEYLKNHFEVRGFAENQEDTPSKAFPISWLFKTSGGLKLLLLTSNFAHRIKMMLLKMLLTKRFISLHNRNFPAFQKYCELFACLYLGKEHPREARLGLGTEVVLALARFLAKFTIEDRALRKRLNILRTRADSALTDEVSILHEDNPLNLDFYLIAALRKKRHIVIVRPFSTGIRDEFLEVLPEINIRASYHDRAFFWELNDFFNLGFQPNCVCQYYPTANLLLAIALGANFEHLEQGFTGVADYYFIDNSLDYEILSSLTDAKDRTFLIEAFELSMILDDEYERRFAISSSSQEINFAVFFPPDQGQSRLERGKFSEYTHLELKRKIIEILDDFLPINVNFTLYFHPRDKNRELFFNKSVSCGRSIQVCAKGFPFGVSQIDVALIFKSALVRHLAYLEIPTFDYDIYEYGYDFSLSENVKYFEVDSLETIPRMLQNLELSKSNKTKRNPSLIATLAEIVFIRKSTPEV